MLFIAEKPSVGRAVAEQLGIIGKEEGYINCKGNNTVTWCFGHLFELAEPDEYLDPSVPEKDGKKIWRWEDLPIVPQKWILLPKKDCKKQIRIISELMKKNSCVVNCGDPDREGQLLIDELLEYLNYSGDVKRYWCNAVDPVSIKRALSALKPNSQYQGMKHAAEARGRADWLVGMNMSRAYTLASRTLITIGRVQSPTLKLVVDRDREIQRFRPKPFYTIKAKFDADGQIFIAELVNDDTVSGQDSEGRLINTDVVRTILTELKNYKDAVIKECKSEIKTRKPPLCFSLSDAQSAASASFGYSAEETLQICQSLYEKKLTTYPRTDCNYLPESQYDDVSGVLSAVKQTMPELSEVIGKADTGIKTKLWNDEKTTAHHAIIPTMSPGNLSSLSEQEKNLYRLIAMRYIANFYPDFVSEEKTITVNVDSLPYTFKAIGRTVKTNGWKSVLADCNDGNDDKNGKEHKNENQALPSVTEGQQIKNIESGFIKQTTTPPSKFTEGSLIKAMENIYKYVVDPEMKKLLKEGDGIGTSATRAGIISELKKRKYLELKGKNIVSTDVGRSVVDTIPERFKSPVMTAIFERILGKIEISNSGTTEFLKHQISEIYNEISKIKDTHIKIDGVREKNISKIYRCMECGGGLIRRNGKNGFWWGCENYPKCKQTYQDSNGKPVYK